jgi:NAD(P)-dependent dehydrogenase (short-subunit alcohol dehydrogenase family)
MASVLITGASKGIGRAIAVEAGKRGHRVVATARNPRTLDDLDVDRRLALDVTDPDGIAAAVAAAGEIDVLVSNAGVIFYSAVEATPPEELARLFDQNTLGALRVAQAVLPGMRARGRGRLLFMSSVVGRVVLPPNAAYASTKWALEALVEALAVETAPLGLEAALLEPGAVSSGALDDVDWFRLPGDPYAHLGAAPIERRTLITPEDVAAETVDAVEAEHLPLRIPVGAPARALLAARHAAPDDVPFVPM